MSSSSQYSVIGGKRLCGVDLNNDLGSIMLSSSGTSTSQNSLVTGSTGGNDGYNGWYGACLEVGARIGVGCKLSRCNVPAGRIVDCETRGMSEDRCL